jgi:vitamin B12 transporter
MNVSHKTAKYYANGSVYETNTDGYSAQAPRYTNVNELEDDGYKNITANLKVGYNFNDSNKIDLSHTLIDARSEFDGCGNQKWSTSKQTYSCSDTTIQKANNSSYYSKTKDTFDSINYNNINNFSKIDVYANSSKFNREYNDTQIYTGGPNNGKILSSKSEYDGTINEFGLKTDIPYQNDNSFVILGTDYKIFEHKNDINEDYNNKSFFVTNSNKFNDDKTIITESLRKDNYDKFDDKTTGKIGIKQYIWNELNISSNYGTAYNAPTLGNLSYTPTLKPETTKSFDVGLEYKDFKVTYFENIITDMINYISGSNPPNYENLNGETTLKGYEFAYKKDLLEDTFFNLNYTLLDTEDNKGQELARRPKDQLGFGVDYYGISKFQFNVNGQYIGDRYNGANKAGAETGNYTVWNSVINYEINKIFSTYLKVDNLFDKYYQTVDGYSSVQRSAYAGLKANF